MSCALPTDERTDEELIAEAAREGSDGPAFVTLMARHRERVWRICYRLLGNEHDAQDAAQEVFVRLFVHRGKFAGRSDLGLGLAEDLRRGNIFRRLLMRLLSRSVRGGPSEAGILPRPSHSPP